MKFPSPLRFVIAAVSAILIPSCGKQEAAGPAADTAPAKGQAVTDAQADTELVDFLARFDRRVYLRSMLRSDTQRELSELPGATDAPPEKKAALEKERARLEQILANPDAETDKQMTSPEHAEDRGPRLARHTIAKGETAAPLYTAAADFMLHEHTRDDAWRISIKCCYYKGEGWKYDSITEAVETGDGKEDPDTASPEVARMFQAMMLDAFVRN